MKGALSRVRWMAGACLFMLLQGSSPHEDSMRKLLPIDADCRPVMTGEARVNLSGIRYFVFRSGREGFGFVEKAKAIGWREADEASEELTSPAGALRMRSFSLGDRRLLVATAPGSPGWAGVALLEEGLMREDRRGEAPGRDLAGWPRPPSLKRILHIEGSGFEAAWYRSPAESRSCLARMREQLTMRGWRVDGIGRSGLVAVRGRNRGLLLMAEPMDGGTCIMVAAGPEP